MEIFWEFSIKEEKRSIIRKYFNVPLIYVGARKEINKFFLTLALM